jgi:hypothetical protein
MLLLSRLPSSGIARPTGRNPLSFGGLRFAYPPYKGECLILGQCPSISVFSVVSLAPTATSVGRAVFDQIDGRYRPQIRDIPTFAYNHPMRRCGGIGHNQRDRFPHQHGRKPTAAAAARRAAPSFRDQIGKEPEATLLRH